MTDQPEEQQPEYSKSVTDISGGVNAHAEQINVGADVVGRDKVIGTYIENYYAVGETAPSKPKVYHNLPQPDYGQFVGREQELKKVHELLSPISRHFVITIDGIGGIGKSALALEVAHRYLHDFEQLAPEERFAAIIWTSAKQTTLTAEGIVQRQQALRTLDDIYSAIAITLQREGITRVRPEEQAEMVRSALTRQRTLLIVDNLETVDDKAVMEFLRELPAPAKAIVTTRHRIDVAYPIRLTGMPWKDAQNLIEQECAKKAVALSDDNQRRLFEHTGGVPLAMTWSVGQMSFGRSVETVLTRLGQPNNDVARFCFEGAVKRISGQPAHYLLMALSLFTTDASRAALGYATELSELDRDEGLVALEILSLINKHGDRFSMLPLTRGYSYSELEEKPDLANMLRTRWAEYLLDYAVRSKEQRWRFAEVDQEAHNILGVIEWCWQTQHIEASLRPILVICPYLWEAGEGKAVVKYYSMGLQAAEQMGDELMHAYFLRRLANIRDFQDDLLEAKRLAGNAADIYRRHDEEESRRGLVSSLLRLSSIEQNLGEWESARRDANECMKVAQSMSESTDLIIRAHCGLARIALDENKHGEAKTSLDMARQLNDALPSTRSVSWVSSYLYRLLGMLSYKEKDYPAALSHLLKSLEKAQAGDNRQEAAQANRFLALVYNALGRSQEARQAAYEALEYFEALGMKRRLREAREVLAYLDAIEA